MSRETPTGEVMALQVILLATYLHRPPALVDLVWQAGGLDAVALVEAESHFNPHALRIEPRGHSSWGLFQLDNEWHLQWRGDIAKHVQDGAAFLDACELASGGDFAAAVSIYNSGTRNGNLAWGFYVKAKRDDMAHFLWLMLREREKE